MPRVTSPCASLNTLPCSLVMSAANASRCSCSKARKRASTRARRTGGVSAQERHAACALATAARTSSAVPSTTWRATAPVAGLNTGRRAPAPLAGRPPIQGCSSSAGAGTGAAGAVGGGGSVETAMKGPVAGGRRNAPIIDHFHAADAYWRASHDHAGPVSDTGVPGAAAPPGLAGVERAPAARVPPAQRGRCRRAALVRAQLPRRLLLLQLGAPHAPAVADVRVTGTRARSPRRAVRAPAAAGSRRSRAHHDGLLGERHGARRRARPAPASPVHDQRHPLRRGAGRLAGAEVRGPAARAPDGLAAAPARRTACEPAV